MRKVTFIEMLFLLVSLLCATGLIFGTLAAKFDPRETVIFAFFGLAYPFLLLINVILCLSWLLRRRWKIALLLFVIIISGFRTINATFKFNGTEGPAVKEPGHLRIMTYNVHNFKEYGSENSASIKQKMLQTIRDQQPDVICFQEFFTRFKGEFDTKDSLKNSLEMPYYYFVPSAKNSYEAIGMAIFSRFPIVNKDFITFGPINGNGGIFADIEFKGKVVRIYNLHLRSISFGKKDYSYLEKVKTEIKPDKQSTKRIYRMLRDAFKLRAADVALVEDELKKCEIPYIVAGDFNDTPASYAVNRLTSNLNNAFIMKGSGLGKTYNGAFPNFQIDYIATTKDIEVVNYHVSRAKLSDHFPVRADLNIK